jgi:hypothetical protein
MCLISSEIVPLLTCYPHDHATLIVWLLLGFSALHGLLPEESERELFHRSTAICNW